MLGISCILFFQGLLSSGVHHNVLIVFLLHFELESHKFVFFYKIQIVFMNFYSSLPPFFYFMCTTMFHCVWVCFNQFLLGFTKFGSEGKCLIFVSIGHVISTLFRCVPQSFVVFQWALDQFCWVSFCFGAHYNVWFCINVLPCIYLVPVCTIIFHCVSCGSYHFIQISPFLKNSKLSKHIKIVFI